MLLWTCIINPSPKGLRCDREVKLARILNIIQVQPVELSAVTDLKQRNPVECGHLLATSPILKFSIMNRKFAKPLLLTIPLPPNTSKPKRPQTAAAGSRSEGGSQEPRPLTARPSTAFQSSRNDDGLYQFYIEIISFDVYDLTYYRHLTRLITGLILHK